MTGTVFALGNRSKAEPVVASSSPDAPELSGTDPVTGKGISLAAFAGKPVVINVWASWCSGCNEEAADLRAFAAAHPETQLVGVETQDAKAAARAFYRHWRWAHPSIFDPHGELAAKLGLQGVGCTNTIFLQITRSGGVIEFRTRRIAAGRRTVSTRRWSRCRNGQPLSYSASSV